jgi:HD-GYP domain-containing protein (c-di-GMP phosphodiesterase class II)
MPNKFPIKLDFIQENRTYPFNLYSEQEELLLPAGTKITNTLLNDLRQKGHNLLYYSLSEKNNDEIDAFIEDEDIQELRNVIKEVFFTLRRTKRLDPSHIEKLKEALFILYSKIKVEGLKLRLISNIKNEDAYLECHPINVSIISMSYAFKQNHKENEVINYGLSGCLYDIGMLFVDKNILAKNDSLTAGERLKVISHPQIGYNLVKNLYFVSDEVKRTILFHHERLKEGYPTQLPITEMPDDVRIIALADTFDSMRFDRPYRKGLDSRLALKKLINSIGIFFSYKMIYEFIGKLGRYLTDHKNCFTEGDWVVTNYKEIARVQEPNDTHYILPIINIHIGENGKFFKKGILIDLRYDHKRRIVRILPDKDKTKLNKIFGYG